MTSPKNIFSIEKPSDPGEIQSCSYETNHTGNKSTEDQICDQLECKGASILQTDHQINISTYYINKEILNNSQAIPIDHLQTHNNYSIPDSLRQFTVEDKTKDQQQNINAASGSSNQSANGMKSMNDIEEVFSLETEPVAIQEQSNENSVPPPQPLTEQYYESYGTNQLSNHDFTSMEIEQDDKFEIYKPIEICSLVNKPTVEFHKENFFKGCKWAPDGTCLLTNSNDNYLRIFDLPSELHCKTIWRPSIEKPKLSYSLKIKEGGIVYDYVWYPKMNSADSFTSYFLSSSMNAPIHLWDSVSGQIEATYRPYNQVDEVTHAYSLAFSPNGNKIFAGFLNEIKVFSTDRPGRQCVERNLKSWFNRAIVSAIAVNPIQPDICALGTYSRMIGLFSEMDGKPLFLLKGHHGGITHLTFASNGILLYSGARMDSEILCWDLRNPGCVLYSFPRSMLTNQRIYFDLTSCSNYLLSGNTNGDVSMWNVNVSSCLPSNPYEESVQEPMHRFSAHQDCTNGVSVHPYYPILGTTCGQRHIPLDDLENEQLIENNLKLWWIGI